MSPQILIVEDEWLIAEDYAVALRDADYGVVGPCATVKAAIAAIDEETVDAALLDVELSGEASLPVAEYLSARGIPFVFVSGHNAREVPPDMRALAHSKPLSHSMLLAAVEKMCTRGQTPTEE
ncbi:response regulator [Roseibium salinum]|uniref:Response regulator n=1 Tax=Roseibium salinum TaxID=1604349 RepID=A0ABT3QX14_9HYPH|nr:response regulator [Roseibium sp. DSM 29163]MCX2721376.1 response regulator [Roseibium sp. DSM 29163]